MVEYDGISWVYNVGPPSYKLMYKPHEYYSYLRSINHSEIGIICTNLAIMNQL